MTTANPKSPSEEIPAPTPPDPVVKAKRHLMQSANGLLLCLEAAKYVCEQWKDKYGYEIPNEHFQAITSTFFIRADRSGLIDKLPNGKINEEKAQ